MKAGDQNPLGATWLPSHEHTCPSSFRKLSSMPRCCPVEGVVGSGVKHSQSWGSWHEEDGRNGTQGAKGAWGQRHQMHRDRESRDWGSGLACLGLTA